MTKGERIKNRRKQCGISQTDLAKKIDVSKQTLYKYENDIITNIPSDAIEKMSIYLECTPDYIMGWKKAESATADKITEYAEKLSKLSPDRLNNAMQYIDFLSKGDNE